MIRKPAMTLGLLCALTTAALAQDKAFTLRAGADLIESGLIDHLRPRFSLKTGIGITLAETDADLALSLDRNGTPALRGPAGTYALSVLTEDPDAARFADWLLSEIGIGTIEGFEAEDGTRYTARFAAEADAPPPLPEGDAAEGARLSLVLCGRCHVVGEVNRMKGLGSTPSFSLLRGFADWQDRFTGFYVLNPHPAFTQIDEVSPPFDPDRYPGIAPLAMTLDELDTIMAYVATMEPADLGAPLLAR